ncbi:MAG: FAD-dependent oxidoreductase [Candidatus Acidiferrales bacterium]
MGEPGKYYVAVIGAATSGSVAAELLADKGIHVAVIEQNNRPYGKIEDGLPRWHAQQRKQEYALIDARLKKPGVRYLPTTKVGREIEFHDFCNKWGFSAVILANGAWRDRDIGVPGAEKFIDKGLLYQNAFIYWYNHKNEKSYNGPRYDAPDGTLVVGGGLASIDVVKILQLENYERALAARGIHVEMHELEKKGIPAICKVHGIDPQSLGVHGCLLIYRRREQDMPLAQPPDNATQDQIAKTEQVRLKLLRLAREKFLFRVQDCTMVTGVVEENGRMAGLRVARTKVEGRKAEPVPGSEHELRAPLVISSIGSVPEALPGVAMKGEYYTFSSEEIPRYMGCERVFGVGNVVTGQGNIRVSLVHSQRVTAHLIENYLDVGASDGNLAPFYEAAEAKAAAQTESMIEQIMELPTLSREQIAAIDSRIAEQQKTIGYVDYDSWIAKVTPPDLE